MSPKRKEPVNKFGMLNQLYFQGISALLDHCMEEGKDIHQRPEAFMGASASILMVPLGSLGMNC
jgi:hypothetical protein